MEYSLTCWASFASYPLSCLCSSRTLAALFGPASLAAASQARALSTHLERTANAQRHRAIRTAVVRKLTDISPSTKSVVLEVLDGDLPFTAGQWVDFHIPGIDTVGGYSIASTPSMLPNLELAVKASKHPPAAWITQTARVGDNVSLRVGGSFGLPSPPTPLVLFIGGGVGIVPLYSMLRSIADGEPAVHAAALLYTASTNDELLFKEELRSLTQAQPSRFRVDTVTTRSGALDGAEASRLDRRAIGEALRWLRSRGGSSSDDAIEVYLCGPKGMPEEMVVECRAAGLPSEAVKFERWW